MKLVDNNPLQPLELEEQCLTYVGDYAAQPDTPPRITVLYTNHEGTLAALRVAHDLARNLGFRVTLVMIRIVPFHFSLTRPHVPVDFLKQLQISVVSEAGIGAEEISVELYLCRDRKQCLQLVLAPHALVVIGGKKNWRMKQERKLERLLLALGYQVIFVDVKPTSEWKAGAALLYSLRRLGVLILNKLFARKQEAARTLPEKVEVKGVRQ
ncbi:MAG TPA: hypothetical protein VK699_06605 [Terriglobales bacterium]|jgi:hypothetical protein|nr:hypothetical protein [Terriglobales bacterium]